MSEGRPFLAFFTDENGKNYISKLKADKPVDAGGTAEIVLWAKNITNNELVDIYITIDDNEATIVPPRISSLKPRELAKITIIWKPSISRTTKLNTTIRSKANEIVR